MRVLVVEDDPMIGRAVLSGQRDSGYATDWVRDGVEAELALANGGYDAALLDLGLPRREGIDILKALRRGNQDLPVLIITARDSVSDRITGLDSGADDYLVKPFSLDELLARIRAVIRRRVGRASPEIRYGALVVDPARRRVVFRDKPVELSAREFAVLEALLQEPGAVVSRQKLEEAVYGWGQEVESNSVEVHLHNLRRKLAAELIRNLRGVGYRVAKID
ncbi:MAG TPA: response regulator [Burkholderiales bacterium]|nr:response regulator [Burkholderiales bacterium]